MQVGMASSLNPTIGTSPQSNSREFLRTNLSSLRARPAQEEASAASRCLPHLRGPHKEICLHWMDGEPRVLGSLKDLNEQPLPPSF